MHADAGISEERWHAKEELLQEAAVLVEDLRDIIDVLSGGNGDLDPSWVKADEFLAKVRKVGRVR